MTSQIVAAADVRPAFLTQPADVVASAGLEVTELAASAGLLLDPWQADALEVALGERADGQWAARQVGLIVPRQNGKGSVLEALELGGLFLFESCRLIIHSAHEFATSAEAFLRLLFLVENTPDLDRLVHKVHRAHGAEGIELKDGTRIKFKTRTSGGGRGFSGDLVVLDEAYNLPDKAISALMPTMSAMPNPQLWVTSSHPLETPESAVLRRFCARGRKGSRGLAYVEYSADVDPDEVTPELLAEPEHWAEANPGYPDRIGDEAIEGELMIMLPGDFAIERLGIIRIDLTERNAWAIPAEDWAACCDPDSEIEGRHVFALDVAEDWTWSAFAAAGRSSLGPYVHAEVVDYRPGTGWVIARAKELKARHGGAVAIAKGSPAASLIDRLKRSGLEVIEVAIEDYARQCGQMKVAAADGWLRHIGQGELDTAVSGAARRDHGDGAFVWGRKKSDVDVAPLGAVTLAAGQFGLIQPGKPYSADPPAAQADDDSLFRPGGRLRL